MDFVYIMILLIFFNKKLEQDSFILIKKDLDHVKIDQVSIIFFSYVLSIFYVCVDNATLMRKNCFISRTRLEHFVIVIY